MDETTMPVEKKGLSRRQVIASGAVGAAAFWSVPVIDSVVSRAAAGSHCPPAAALAISGAAVVYQLPNDSHIYWAAFAANGTICEDSPSVPQDDDFGPVGVCGAFIQVSSGNVLYGTTALNGAIPDVVANGCGCTTGSSGCYFTATASGINVTSAGVTAGVTVLVFLFHNGTFSGCETFGSKGHWAIGCGSTNPQCASVTNCIPPPV